MSRNSRVTGSNPRANPPRNLNKEVERALNKYRKQRRGKVSGNAVPFKLPKQSPNSGVLQQIRQGAAYRRQR